jgi:hypothetical protein
MADGFTSRYGFTKPEVTASDDTWGDKLNVDLDNLDIVLGDNLFVDVTTNPVLTEANCLKQWIILQGTQSANNTVTFPEKARHYVVRNDATGAFTVTLETAAVDSESIDITQDSTCLIWVNSDGDVKLLHEIPEINSFTKFLLNNPDAATWRTDLGLGTAATKNTGGSGNVVPLLDGANTWSANQAISTSSATGQLTVTSTAASSGTSGPDIVAERNGGAASAGHKLGEFKLRGRNSANASTLYATIAGEVVDPTAGAEAGRGILRSMVAGATGDRASWGSGFYMAGTTDPGDGNINALAYYINGAKIRGDTGFARYRYEVGDGANGGTATSGSWQTYPLNDEVVDDIGITLSANTLTVPAGVYDFFWWCTFYACEIFATRLVRGGSTIITRGTTGQGGATISATCLSFGGGSFTLPSSSAVNIEYRVQSTRTNDGLGRGQHGSTWGHNNVFGEIFLHRIA